MKKLLIAGALALTAVLGAPSGASAAGVEEVVTAPPVQGTEPLGLVITADTVFGATGNPKPVSSCAQSNLFGREQRIVFRVWGVDVKHGGVALTKENVEEAYVEIPGVPVAETKLKYGEHSRSKTEPIKHAFWTLGWTPGASYPTGIVKFRVVMKSKPYKTMVQTKVNASTKKASKNAKKVPYVFRGVYTGKNSVKVENGNSWVKKAGFVKKTVKFDLTDSKVTAEDNNADGKVDLKDIKAGDKVAVEARLPRADHGKQPFKASRLLEEWMVVVEPGLTGYYSQENFAESSVLKITP
jgi:hypothetical protein